MGKELVVVVYFCNPSTIENFKFKASVGCTETPHQKANKIAGCWWLTPIIPATQEAEREGSWFEASMGK
jgi:hypothetical protein